MFTGKEMATSREKALEQDRDTAPHLSGGEDWGRQEEHDAGGGFTR